MKARFLPPRENYSGNLLWNKESFSSKKAEIDNSLNKLREMGYWASPFPEGDGVTFNIYDKKIIRNNEQMLDDFVLSFDWVDIMMRVRSCLLPVIFIASKYVLGNTNSGHPVNQFWTPKLCN
ncbi:MAG: hypothetical protein GY787_33395 [Alteromonadales bacterium]|nr:hypothetical protein [Alteromonadales bacterium]